MKRIMAGAAAAAVAAGAAQAGGIDRAGNSLGVLFEPGNRVVELSFGFVTPTVSGNDVAAFGGGPSGNVADNYTQLALSYKQQLTDSLSLGLVIDQPYGADVLYGPGSIALGGTRADARATAISGILRYKMPSNLSVHGGIRVQRSKGQIDLRGLAYGGFNGYSVDLASDTSVGYLVGVAYERPEIALRLALTYYSKIEHDFATVETVGPIPVATSTTRVNTPQAVNLDFQSGIAKDTLVFGQIRWVDWSDFRVDPLFFTPLAGGGLIDLEDTVTYTLGVGRRFNENWSGAFSMSYEAKGDPLVSPLAPTNGRLGATVAAVYTRDNMKITTGINYTALGDAQPETGTPDVARANFTGNYSWGFGMRVAFTF